MVGNDVDRIGCCRVAAGDPTSRLGRGRTLRSCVVVGARAECAVVTAARHRAGGSLGLRHAPRFQRSGWRGDYGCRRDRRDGPTDMRPRCSLMGSGGIHRDCASDHRQPRRVGTNRDRVLRQRDVPDRRGDVNRRSRGGGAWSRPLRRCRLAAKLDPDVADATHRRAAREHCRTIVIHRGATGRTSTPVLPFSANYPRPQCRSVRDERSWRASCCARVRSPCRTRAATRWRVQLSSSAGLPPVRIAPAR
jgi:hypothetical protein